MQVYRHKGISWSQSTYEDVFHLPLGTNLGKSIQISRSFLRNDVANSFSLSIVLAQLVSTYLRIKTSLSISQATNKIMHLYFQFIENIYINNG